MGQWADFTCDECGVTFRRIFLFQPDCGFAGSFLQKYCRKTGKIIHILLPFETHNEDFKNVDLPCPKSSKAGKKKKGELLSPDCKGCNSEYLTSLQTVKKKTDKLGEEYVTRYKCPCPDCKGLLHYDPRTLAWWD